MTAATGINVERSVNNAPVKKNEFSPSDYGKTQQEWMRQPELDILEEQDVAQYSSRVYLTEFP